jgi:hypothetical protein
VTHLAPDPGDPTAGRYRQLSKRRVLIIIFGLLVAGECIVIGIIQRWPPEIGFGGGALITGWTLWSTTRIDLGRFK